MLATAGAAAAALPAAGAEPNGGCVVVEAVVRNTQAGPTPGTDVPRVVPRGGNGAFELISRVRESVLTTGTAPATDIKAAGVTPHVLDSWRRCLHYGLTPGRTRPEHMGDVDLDNPLTRVAETVVGEREAVLEQSLCGLTLTDGTGTVLRQWVRDQALGRWLQRHDIQPAFSVDETHIGTTSGICLLSGQPTMVRGPEHFAEEYHGVTSAGVVVVHPVTHRVVGSLNLTSRFEDTSPVLLSWVMELARDIRRMFQETATRRERVLLNAYLTENRDARHPLVALDEQTIITNAIAARFLTPVDQALLWEHASRAIRERRPDARRLVLTDGTVVSVECKEVGDVSGTVGAVLRIRPVVERAAQSPATTSVPVLGQLAGRGPRWRELCRRAHAIGTGPVLVTGERGTGRLAVAEAVAGDAPVTVVDAADAAANGSQAWLRELETCLAGPARSAVVIRRCDELDPAVATAAANLVRAHRDGPVRMFATARHSAHHDRIAPLLAEFTEVLEVPALRDRIEDLPVLLEALTGPAFERLGRAPRPVRWMPDVVQALSRLDWSGNVASLGGVVLEALRGNNNGYISAGDLPAGVVASAARRKLAGLEQVEATAIIAALRATQGNKNKAADALGIARSTLYRKMRALGIDLSATAF